MKPTRVVFCWAEITGYMAACWQALAKHPGVSVHVLHTRKLFNNRPNPFELEPLLNGLTNSEFDAETPDIDRWLLSEVTRLEPDVVVLCGWMFSPYRRLMQAPGLGRAAMILGMDSPWLGNWRQRVGRHRLRRVAQRTDLAVTASERSAEYARRIGVPPARIRNGYYGFDYDRFGPVADQRAGDDAWPRQFLFVGRYDPEKDLPTLIAAYSEYRRGVSDPWGLTCCGIGADAPLLKGVEGITDVGFTQPVHQPNLFRRHGAFILPSKFEPWGVVLAEAAASGLPVICTTACGAGADIVRPHVNGLVTQPGDAGGLARAMRWVHDHESALREMGRQGQGFAQAFSAQSWATRWERYLREAIALRNGDRAK